MRTTNQSTSRPTYDLVFSFSPQDRGLASFIRRAFTDSGMSTFDLQEFPPPESSELGVLRESLVDSTAMVILATPYLLESENLPLGVGAAMTWRKPIFVLYDGVPRAELPGYLTSWPVHSLDELDVVVESVRRLRRPLTDDEQRVLADVFEEFEIPTDQLLVNRPSLDRLAQRFNERQGTRHPSDRLAHELVRMRKQGRLPRLRRTVNGT